MGVVDVADPCGADDPTFVDLQKLGLGQFLQYFFERCFLRDAFFGRVNGAIVPVRFDAVDLVERDALGLSAVFDEQVARAGGRFSLRKECFYQAPQGERLHGLVEVGHWGGRLGLLEHGLVGKSGDKNGRDFEFLGPAGEVEAPVTALDIDVEQGQSDGDGLQNGHARFVTVAKVELVEAHLAQDHFEVDGERKFVLNDENMQIVHFVGCKIRKQRGNFFCF